MGIKYQPINVTHAALAVAALAVVYLAYKSKDQAAAAVKAAAQSVDPTSTENLVYKGVNHVGAAVSGDQSFSLGSWLYDVTHPNEFPDLNAGTI